MSKEPKKEPIKWWAYPCAVLAVVAMASMVLSIPSESIVLFCYGLLGFTIFSVAAGVGGIDVLDNSPTAPIK
jgi:hypothetical protein